MTEETQDQGQEPTELETLKARATQMGIKFHHKTGVKKLKALIEAKMNESEPEAHFLDAQYAEPEKEPAPRVATKASEVNMERYDPVVHMTEAQRRNHERQEALKLVRVRIMCMDPDKKEWDGEIFSVGNSLIGTVKKFVPYNSDVPYHVPRIILNAMKEKKVRVMKTTVVNGQSEKKSVEINAFSIEELPPMNSEEFEMLKKSQAARDGIQ